MKLRYALLQGMRSVDIANAFNGNDMLAIDANQGEETGIDRQMLYPPLIIAAISHLQHYCAGTASSFTTPKLGPLEVRLGADVVQQCPVRVRVADDRSSPIYVACDVWRSVCRFDQWRQSFGGAEASRRLCGGALRRDR